MATFVLASTIRVACSLHAGAHALMCARAPGIEETNLNGNEIHVLQFRSFLSLS